jgi:hypothetical protein
MISLRDVAKLVRESNSLIWPAAPTDLERVEAAVRWLRNELDDMKDRDAWRSPLEPAACVARRGWEISLGQKGALRKY